MQASTNRISASDDVLRLGLPIVPLILQNKRHEAGDTHYRAAFYVVRREENSALSKQSPLVTDPQRCPGAQVAHDSRRGGSAPTRSAHRRQNTGREGAFHPAQRAGTCRRAVVLEAGSTSRPRQIRAYDDHERRGSPLGGGDWCPSLHRAPTPISKAHLPQTT